MKSESQTITRRPRVDQGVVLVSPEEMAFTEMDARRRRESRIAMLRLLWDKRLPLSKIFLGGLIVFMITAFLIPSKYESTARLMPPDPQSGSGLTMLAALAGRTGGGDALTGIAGDILGMKTSGDLFIGVLSSRTVQDDLIKKFDLRKAYGERRWEDARKKLTARTDLSSDRKSGIISITVTDRSPERASAMATEYVQELNWVVTQLNTSTAHRERVFLEGRLREVQRDLEASEKDFSQFASKNVALDIPSQGKAMVEATAALEGELIGAETELQGLKQIYADGNVKVRSTQARVDELQHQLQKLGGKIPADGDTTQPELESLYPSLRKLPLLGVQYADLLRRDKIQEAVYETLTQQYELAKVEEVKETPSVKVLDTPDIPERKSFPPRLLITVSGAVFAFLVGCMLVIWRSEWERVDPEDPARMLFQEVSTQLRSRMPSVFHVNGFAADRLKKEAEMEDSERPERQR